MNIDTSKMADTEMSSTIPPWPVDFGPQEPKQEPEQVPEGFAISLLAVVGVIVGTAFVVNLVARIL